MDSSGKDIETSLRAVMRSTTRIKLLSTRRHLFVF